MKADNLENLALDFNLELYLSVPTGKMLAQTDKSGSIFKVLPVEVFKGILP